MQLEFVMSGLAMLEMSMPQQGTTAGEMCTKYFGKQAPSAEMAVAEIQKQLQPVTAAHSNPAGLGQRTRGEAGTAAVVPDCSRSDRLGC